MASGWNLWVWSEYIGVVKWCCKELYRLPHNITYPYSTCISFFFVAASLLLCSFFRSFLSINSSLLTFVHFCCVC